MQVSQTGKSERHSKQRDRNGGLPRMVCVSPAEWAVQNQALLAPALNGWLNTPPAVTTALALRAGCDWFWLLPRSVFAEAGLRGSFGGHEGTTRLVSVDAGGLS
jgi:hypothetical protein